MGERRGRRGWGGESGEAGVESGEADAGGEDCVEVSDGILTVTGRRTLGFEKQTRIDLAIGELAHSCTSRQSHEASRVPSFSKREEEGEELVVESAFSEGQVVARRAEKGQRTLEFRRAERFELAG